MLYFCTLFDSNYSAKGLVMYYSLLKYCSHFHLYIFAFDNDIYRVLTSMNLENVTVVSLTEFEDEALLSIKEKRTEAEYCWTSTSSTILYCITQFKLSHCTYIDADICFFSNPKVLVDEMSIKDVLITSHRYTPEFDKTETSGKYCVQFVTFRNTENGLKVLNWWKDACINWCYGYYEDGKFGDQMYLDDWTTRFTGIHELEHLGGGVAPWNMQQYSFLKSDNKLIGTELSNGNTFELVFFHFHALLSSQKGFLHEFNFEAYPLPSKTKEYIYMPYVSKLKKQYRQLMQFNKCIDGIATKEINISWWKYAKVIRKRILNKDNKYSYWIGR